MIKKILNNSLILNSKPSESVISAAFVVTMAGLASRLLGLLRDRFLASTFGAGDTLDVYYAAFRVPDLIYNLLILGALSAAFIPVFTGLISKEQKEEAWKMANGILNLAIVFILSFSALLAIFAPQVMKIITPGFSDEKLQSVILFTRIMFLSPLFLGISGIFGGILTSFKRFLIYSVAPLLYNIGIIFGILVFVRFWGPVGLAWGVVFGAAMHMLFQYPAAKFLGFKFNWDLKATFSNTDVKRVLFLMIPRVMGIAVSQINLLVITIFASLLASGSLAIFNFAQNLQSVPLGLIGVSFSIAVFPVLSSLSARKEKAEFTKAFSETFRQIMFFIIPISIFMLVLRAQIVRVILGTGEFDWKDTVLTFQCLEIFVLSLFAQCLTQLLARSFYALHDTKTPFYVALASEMINILTIFLLFFNFEDGHVFGPYNFFGYGQFQFTFFKVYALAIAFAVSSVVQMFLLLFFLRSRFDNLDDKNIIKSLFKVCIASFCAGIAIQAVKVGVGILYQNKIDTFVGIFSQLVAASVAGLIVFLSVCYFLKLEEFFRLKNSLTRKLFRTKQLITEDTSDVSGI